MRNLIAAVTISALVTGCATNLVPMKIADNGVPIAGDPYSLFIDQFDIKIAYKLASCEGVPEIEVSVDAENKRIEDPDHLYYLNTSDLSSAFKTSDVAIKYHPNRMVASLNATAEDKTVEVVSGIVKAVVGVAKMAVAGGAAVQSVAASKTYANCNADTAVSLRAYDAKKEDVKNATDALDQKQAKFSILESRVEALSPAIDRKLTAEFSNAYLAYQMAAKRLENEKDKLKKLEKALTLVKSVTWPTKGSEFDGSYGLSGSEFKQEVEAKWFRGGIFDSQRIDTMRASLVVAFKIVPRQAGGSTSSTTLDIKQLSMGLPYRSPMPGYLKIIQPTLFDPKGTSLPASTLYEKEFSILQLGRIHLKSCRSKALTSGGCSIAFNTDGQLIEAGSKTTKTFGQSVSSVASETVTQLSEFKTLKDTQRAKAKEDELKLLELDNKITAARAAQTEKPPTEVALLNDQIALFDAERKLIEARQNLDKAKALLPVLSTNP